MPVGYNTYNEIVVIGDESKRKKLEEFVADKVKGGKAPTASELREYRWNIGGTKKGSSKQKRKK